MASTGRPNGAKGYQRILRMEMVARMEAKLIYSAQQIADMLDLTIGGLNTLKMDPEFAQVKARVMDKVITTLDEDLATDLKGMKSRIRTMVPVALDILFEHLTGTNPRISMDAAKTILDRDGRLVPVSKTTVVAETAEGHSVTGTDDMVASELSAAMGALNGGESKTVQ